MFETIKRELNEFRNFAIKGNIVDMAVGIIIGASFSGVVNSLVNDIIMPPMGWLMGKVDFTNLYILLPTTDEPVKISYGIFINSVISFLIMAFAVFLLIRGINKLQALAKKQEEAKEAAAPTTKECPRCKSEIHIEASKCPHCTADI